MNLAKCVPLLVLLALTSISLNAEWRPDILTQKNTHALAILNQPDVLDLKKRIFDYVNQSWCSHEKSSLLFELVLITKPKVCVEIGAFMGASTLPLLAGLQYVQKGEAFIIDSWSNDEAIRGLPSDDPNTIWWAGLDMPIIKSHFDHMVNYWSLSSSCHILEMTSKEAADHVPSIDFLHLDGNFSEKGAFFDSEQYVPKVVPGGYVLISNVLVMIGGKPTKMKALWPIFDQCDIVCEIDAGNTLLFRKRMPKQK